MRWVLAFVGLLGCAGPEPVALEIHEPAALPMPAGYELRVYRSGECPSAEQFADRAAPFAAPLHAQAFAGGGTAAPVGELSEGIYVFAVLARDAACAPIAYGCTVSTLGNEPVVAVELAAAPAIAVARACGSDECTGGVCNRAGCSASQEICNGADDDCDGLVDDGFAYQVVAETEVAMAGGSGGGMGGGPSAAYPHVSRANGRWTVSYASGGAFLASVSDSAAVEGPWEVYDDADRVLAAWLGGRHAVVLEDRDTVTCGTLTCTNIHLVVQWVDAAGMPVDMEMEIEGDIDGGTQVGTTGNEVVIAYGNDGLQIRTIAMDGSISRDLEVDPDGGEDDESNGVALVTTREQWAVAWNPNDLLFATGTAMMAGAPVMVLPGIDGRDLSMADDGSGYGIVWRDSATDDLQMVSTSREGTARGTPATIVAAAVGLDDHAIAGARGQLLLLARDAVPGLSFARFAADGSVLQPATPLAATTSEPRSPDLAWEGSRGAAVWQDFGSGAVRFAAIGCPP
jgi:hypothetical protein